MRALQLPRTDKVLSVLCLGAHADDIEIGAGATLLTWLDCGIRLAVHWCVLSGATVRAAEARASATAFLSAAHSSYIEMLEFRDGFFPQQGEAIKSWFETLKTRCTNPDFILTHHRDDAHQDHREICRLTWNTFRNHCIFEYEIPKWDGDWGQPNLYVPIAASTIERKIDLLLKHFASQHSKHWFDAELFRGLARLRGMECCAPERYAEAFFARKIALLPNDDSGLNRTEEPVGYNQDC